MSTKRELVSGVAYTAVSKYIGIIVSLVVVGVLSRLISPEDFGVIAIATVIISFFSIFSDLGIAPAIVQNKDLTKTDLSDIFCFTIWSGVILSVAFFFSSWPIASFYNNTILRPICQILSINLFFSTLNIIPNALLRKNKEFKFIAYLNLIVQLIGGLIAVIAALAGAGLYALLVNPIFSSIVLFLAGFIKYPQKIRWVSGIHAMKKIFNYSAYQFLFNVINYFSRNSDKLLIGRYIGMTPLGFYEKSYRLMMLPLQNITHVITPVMHPIFSEYQNNPAYLSKAYLKIVRLLAFIGFPASILLYFTAKELVLLIFGMQWTASVPVFQILALSVGTQVILSTCGSIFQAANDTRMLFISGLISAVLNVSGMLIGVFVFKTIEAVAWGICISFALCFIQSYVLMYRYTFRFSMVPFWKQLVSPLILSSILFIGLFAAAHYTATWNLWFSLCLKGSIFAIFSIIYIQYTNEFDIYGKGRYIIKRIKNGE